MTAGGSGAQGVEYLWVGLVEVCLFLNYRGVLLTCREIQHIRERELPTQAGEEQWAERQTNTLSRTSPEGPPVSE